MTPEYDEYGVLIKRRKDVDEFGIPLKKKEASSGVSKALSAAGSVGVDAFDLEAQSTLTEPNIDVSQLPLRGQGGQPFLANQKIKEPEQQWPVIKIGRVLIPVKIENIPSGYDRSEDGARQYAADMNSKLQTSSLANDNVTYSQAVKEVEKMAALNRMDTHPGVVNPKEYDEIGRIITNAPKSKVDVVEFSDIAISNKINADPGLSGMKNVDLPDDGGAWMRKPTTTLLNKLVGVKKALEFEVSTANRWAEKPQAAKDLIEINQYIKKVSNSLQPEVNAEQQAVVKSADTRSDLNKMTTSMAKEIQAQMNLYNVETLNNAFFTGLEARRFTDKVYYDNVKRRLSEGKTLASTEVAELTAAGGHIIDGKNLQKLHDGEIDIDQYADKYDQVSKQQENNVYKRPDVLQRSIANVIGEYYADEGTQFFGKWHVSDKEIDSVPAYVFELAGIDIARPESKEAIRKIKENEGVLPFDNAVQKDSYIKEMGRGFIAPVKGIFKAVENAPKGDNELLVERKLEPITDYEKQRTEYFDKNYGKIADAFNGAGQFVSQVALMVGGAGAIRGIGRAVGGSTEVAVVASPEAATLSGVRSGIGGNSIRMGNELGNTIINHAKTYSNLAVPFIQTYDANYKSALEKTNNPWAARGIAFTNSMVESLAEQVFNNPKFAKSVIADFNGKNFVKIAKIFDRQVFDQAAGLELRNTIKEGLEGSMKAVAKGASGLVQESFEEVPVQFADFVTSAMADPESVKDRHLLPELKDAFVAGMVSFSIPSLLGVAGRIKRQFSDNGTQDDALMLAARNRDMVMEAIFSQLENGGISQQEADHKIQVLNTAVNSLHNMPPVYMSGENMSEADRVKYLSLSVQEKLIKQQMNKAEDPALNDANQVRLDEIKNKKVAILASIPDKPKPKEEPTTDESKFFTEEAIDVLNSSVENKELKGMYAELAATNPIGVLKEIAQQAQGVDENGNPTPGGPAVEALKNMGVSDGLIESAIAAFPASVSALMKDTTSDFNERLQDTAAAQQLNNVTTVDAHQISRPIELIPADTSKGGVKVIHPDEISPTVELNPKLPEDQEQDVKVGEDMADKKADIERKREEANNSVRIVIGAVTPLTKDASGNDGAYRVTASNSNGKYKFPELHGIEGATKQEVIDKVNAKYDEELSSLESSVKTSKTNETKQKAEGVTQEATDLLASIGAGSKPTFITKNLERIAAENGIVVTGNMTADDVVSALRAKAGAQAKAPKGRVPAATMAVMSKFGVTPEVAKQIEGIAAQAKDVDEFKTMVKELLNKSRTLEASQGDFAGTNVNLESVDQQQVDTITGRASDLANQEVVEFTPAATNNVEVARGVLEDAGGVVWQEFPNAERMDAAGLRTGAADQGGPRDGGPTTGQASRLHRLGFGDHPGSNQKAATTESLIEVLTGPGYTDEQRGMAAAYIAAQRLLSESDTDVVARIFGRAANSSKDSRGRIRIISNLNPEAPVISASDLGFIVINAAKLGNRLKEFGGENKFLRWLDAALLEEAIHLATYKVTSSADLTAVAKEMTADQKQAVQDLYNPPALRNKEMSDFQMASEYLRILVQERMSGVSTEIFKPQATRTKVRQVFAKLLAFIKNTFRGNTNPKATEVVNKIESLVRGEETAQNRVTLNLTTFEREEILNFIDNRRAIVNEGDLESADEFERDVENLNSLEKRLNSGENQFSGQESEWMKIALTDLLSAAEINASSEEQAEKDIPKIKKSIEKFDSAKPSSTIIAKPVVKIFERPDMESPVYKVSYNGKDTFVQRSEGMNPSDTAWYEVVKRKGRWESPKGQVGVLSDGHLGYTQAEALSTIVGRSGNEAGVSDSFISPLRKRYNEGKASFLASKENWKPISLPFREKVNPNKTHEYYTDGTTMERAGKTLLRVFEIKDPSDDRLVSDVEETGNVPKPRVDGEWLPVEETSTVTGNMARASDDDIDADLEDMWGSMRGTPGESVKASGIKKALVSQDIIEGVDLDKIGDLDMMALGRKIIKSGQVKPAALVTKIITEKQGVLTPAEVVALITYKADLDNSLRAAYKGHNEKTETGEDTGTLPVEIKDIERQVDDFDVAAVITANQQSMAFRLRKMMLDRDYNIVTHIERYKRNNNGYIPPEVEAKFREYDRQLKDLKDRLSEAEKLAEQKSDQEAVDNIKDDVDREAQRSTKLSEEQIAEKIKKGIQSEIDAIHEKLPKERKRLSDRAIEALERFQKNIRGKSYSDVGGFVAIIDAGVTTIKNAIKAGVAIADAIELGINKIKDLLSKKGIKTWPKEDEFRKDMIDGFESEGVSTTKKKKEAASTVSEEGKLTVPNQMLRDLVSRGITDIDELTDAVHEKLSKTLPGVTKRQVRDAITEYGKKVNPSADEIQQQLNTAKRVGRLLSELEDLQNGIKKEKNPSTKAKLTERERGLQKQINLLSKNIPLTDIELSRKEDASLASRKDRVRQKILELQQRIKAKDFSKPKRLPAAQDAELVKLNAEKEELQQLFDELQYKNELQNRPWAKKIEDWALEIFSGLPRMLVAGFDFSAGFIQGTWRLFTNPGLSLRAYQRMFADFASEAKQDEWMNRLKANPLYPMIEASGLAISDKHGKASVKEGLFIINWANLIYDFAAKVITLNYSPATNFIKRINPLKASQRAFDGYVNAIRVGKFVQLAKRLYDDGYSFEADPKIFQKTADFVNTTTGRGGLGAAENSSKWLNIVLFAPRKVISEMKLFTPYAFIYYARMPKVVRHRALLDFAKFVTSFATVNGLIWAALKDWDDDDEEDNFWNMNSSDFMTHSVGNQRIGVGGGAKTALVFMSRLFSGKFTDQYGKDAKLGERYGKQINSRLDLAFRFLLGKGSPSVSVIAKKMDEKKGLEVDDAELLKNLVVPIWMQDAQSLYKDNPAEIGGLFTVLSIFGANVRTVEKEKTAKEKRKEKKEKEKQNK